MKDLARKYSNDWDRAEIKVEDNLITISSYDEGKVQGYDATYRMDGTFVMDLSSTSVPASMLVDDFIKEGKSFEEALIAVYDDMVKYLTAIDEKSKKEVADKREQTSVTCPYCENEMEIPADLDLTKIAIDCDNCNRIIECDMW